MSYVQTILGVVIVGLVGIAIANPRSALTKPAETTVVQPADDRVKPEGVIGDSKALVAEVRATLKAFNEGGLSVKLAKPPTTPRATERGLPGLQDRVSTAACPGGRCIVTPSHSVPVPAASAGGGAERRQPIRNWLRSRRGG